MSSNIVQTYRPDLALRLCEEIAQGHTIVELTSAEDSPYPSRATVYRWIMQYPEFAKAYGAAREISANSFEEEALWMARELKKGPPDNARTRAYEVAMGQLRWSAARRNPREYGDKGNTNIVVPITINTPLDMGGGQGAGLASIPNIYKIEAKVETPVDAEFSEVNPRTEPEPALPEPLLSPKHKPKESGRAIRKRRTQSGEAMKRAREAYAKAHGEA